MFRPKVAEEAIFLCEVVFFLFIRHIIYSFRGRGAICWGVGLSGMVGHPVQV
jgi:hypothetical protein